MTLWKKLVTEMVWNNIVCSYYTSGGSVTKLALFAYVSWCMFCVHAIRQMLLLWICASLIQTYAWFSFLFFSSLMSHICISIQEYILNQSAFATQGFQFSSSSDENQRSEHLKIHGFQFHKWDLAPSARCQWSKFATFKQFKACM